MSAEPDSWLCPFVLQVYASQETREFPCFEILQGITRGDSEQQGICDQHGVFRWDEVGGWTR